MKSFGEIRCIFLQTENQNKNEDLRKYKDISHHLPDWLQDFRVNLVDESSPTKPRGNPAPKDRDTASSSHELPMVQTTKFSVKKVNQSRNNHPYAVVEPTRKPNLIYTDNSLEFGTSCEELSWNRCASTPHRSETNGVAERAVHRVKEGTLLYCCNQV